jgi:hypothetical protein
MEIYIEDDQYDRLVAALLTLQPSPVTGEVGPDEVKIALGEIGDIWPARVEAETEFRRASQVFDFASD